MGLRNHGKDGSVELEGIEKQIQCKIDASQLKMAWLRYRACKGDFRPNSKTVDLLQNLALAAEKTNKSWENWDGSVADTFQ